MTIQQALAEAVAKNLNTRRKTWLPIAEARIITARLRPNPVLTVEGDHLDLLGTGYNKENAVIVRLLNRHGLAGALRGSPEVSQ